MAKAPDTDHARVQALLGSGFMLSKLERADILDIVARLEQRVMDQDALLRGVTESADMGRAGVIREVYDRLSAVMELADPPGEIGSHWIGVALGIVLSMEHEEVGRG